MFSLFQLKKIFQLNDNFFYWLKITFLSLIIFGLILSLIVSPKDYLQGDTVRIMYVHVPASWLALMIFAGMGISSIIWKIKVFEVLSIASAKNGAMFTFLALVTGSIWGKPMWGTWWVWDARLTSELILFFIYLSIIFLYHAYDDYRKGAKAANILAIVGFINIPIIHFSVEWWNTLHQGPSVMKFSSPSIASEMFLRLLFSLLILKY